jgi:hypothetical protein
LQISRKVIVSARIRFNAATLSARTLRVSAMRMSARSLNDCIGAARCAPPGLSLASEGTVMLALLPFGETSNAMTGSLIDVVRSTA